MYSKRKGSRAVSHGLATTGNKIYCTLWKRVKQCLCNRKVLGSNPSGVSLQDHR